MMTEIKKKKRNKGRLFRDKRCKGKEEGMPEED